MEMSASLTFELSPQCGTITRGLLYTYTQKGSAIKTLNSVLILEKSKSLFPGTWGHGHVGSGHR